VVLGIYDGPSGGAALVQDGRLLAIAEEDRIVRQHRVSGLPRSSVQAILRETGVAPETLSAVVVATQSSPYAEGTGASARPPLLYRVGTAAASPVAVERKVRATFAKARRRRIDEALRSEFGVACPVKFLDHHAVHGLAAVALSGTRDALLLTMDSGADGRWLQVASVEHGPPRRIASQAGSASLLGFLDAVCDCLGLTEGLDRHRRLEDLGSRGSPACAERFFRRIEVGDGRIEVSESLLRRGGVLADTRATFRREDLAASALHVVGDVVRRFAVSWFERAPRRDLLLGGDLFDIPAVVREVRDAPELPAALVPLAPGDAGLPAGCAFAGCLDSVLEAPFPCPEETWVDPFRGVEFEDAHIEETLRLESVEFRLLPRIESDVARALAEGRSVARFDGKTELGNLGLGNRVVLRSPRGELRRGRLGFLLAPGSYHTLIREECFDDWLDAGGLDPARLRSAPGLVTPTERFARECPDLIGWRGCARVQTVSAQMNPRLHEILAEFETWTGLPLLATAPFRLPDEPLVSSPRDALRTFRLLGPDFAAIGRCLVGNPDAEASSSGAGRASAGSRR